MLNLKINLLFFLFTLMIASCNSITKENKAISGIDEMQWMLGEWKQIITDPAHLYLENWERLNDSTYAGTSAMLDGADTLFSESIQIRFSKKGAPVYSTNVYNGKSSHQVVFILIESSDKKLVFENKQNDFPQRVIYYQTPSDSLIAIINGNENGKFKEQYFSMGRNK